MTPEVELAARIVGQRDRAAEIKRCQEKLARLMQEQETAWQRIMDLQKICLTSPTSDPAEKPST